MTKRSVLTQQWSRGPQPESAGIARRNSLHRRGMDRTRKWHQFATRKDIIRQCAILSYQRFSVTGVKENRRCARNNAGQSRRVMQCHLSLQERVPPSISSSQLWSGKQVGSPCRGTPSCLSPPQRPAARPRLGAPILVSPVAIYLPSVVMGLSRAAAHTVPQLKGGIRSFLLTVRIESAVAGACIRPLRRAGNFKMAQRDIVYLSICISGWISARLHTWQLTLRFTGF